eukprot:165646-Chlamydomonas_euryale.AAC.2
MGIVVLALGMGGSAHWWKNKHNRHHATPNRLDSDTKVRRCGGVKGVGGVKRWRVGGWWLQVVGGFEGLMGSKAWAGRGLVLRGWIQTAWLGVF